MRGARALARAIHPSQVWGGGVTSELRDTPLLTRGLAHGIGDFTLMTNPGLPPDFVITFCFTDEKVYPKTRSKLSARETDSSAPRSIDQPVEYIN